MCKVLSGQTLFDIAIQSCGGTEAAYELAVLNGLNLTDDLVSGQELVLPDVVNSDIVHYYQNNKIQPATLLTVHSQLIGSVIDTFIRDISTIKNNLIPVFQGQTIFDIAIQEFGSVEAAFDLATLNGFSITDDLVPGALLQKTTVINKKITAYYTDKQIKPATDISSSPDQTRIFDFTFDFTFN
jgi:hypothetical protein